MDGLPAGISGILADLGRPPISRRSGMFREQGVFMSKLLYIQKNILKSKNERQFSSNRDMPPEISVGAAVLFAVPRLRLG